jgi:hypothetical protein
MPKFGPVKRKDLIRYMRISGFDGLFSGAKYQFMIKGDMTVWIPNPHEGDIGRELLIRILKQAHITKNEWENY